MNNDPSVQKALEHARIDLQAAKVLAQNTIGEPNGINQTLAMIDAAMVILTSSPQSTAQDKLLWLINCWKVAAERSQSLALKVSGEGEAAEIYRDTEKALRELYATRS